MSETSLRSKEKTFALSSLIIVIGSLFVSCNMETNQAIEETSHSHCFDFRGSCECGTDVSETLDNVYDSLQFEGLAGTKYYFNVCCYDEPITLHLDSESVISSVMNLSFYAEDGSLLYPQTNDVNLTFESIEGLLYIVIEPTVDGEYTIFLTE